MVRHGIRIGEHAEADPQPLHRVEARRGREQLRHVRKGADACRCQSCENRSLVAAAPRKAVPEKRGDALEAARADEVLDRLPADDQPAGLPIDLAHHRVGHDHAVEPAVHPCLQHRKSPC